MNVAFTLTLADPVLHQIPVLYEGGGEDSWGDGDTGIDLDMHSTAGDNVRDFFRVRGFPFGGGRRLKVREKFCCCRPRLDSGT